jgi:hypothetical protein
MDRILCGEALFYQGMLTGVRVIMVIMRVRFVE